MGNQIHTADDWRREKPTVLVLSDWLAQAGYQVRLCIREKNPSALLRLPMEQFLSAGMKPPPISVLQPDKTPYVDSSGTIDLVAKKSEPEAEVWLVEAKGVQGKTPNYRSLTRDVLQQIAILAQPPQSGICYGIALPEMEEFRGALRQELSLSPLKDGRGTFVFWVSQSRAVSRIALAAFV